MFNLSQFHYEKPLKTLVADASTLGIGPGVNPFYHLFNDACDVGIEIYSEKTGNTAAFVLASKLYSDMERNLIGWKYVPVHMPRRVDVDLEVIIYNS